MIRQSGIHTLLEKYENLEKQRKIKRCANSAPQAKTSVAGICQSQRFFVYTKHLQPVLYSIFPFRITCFVLFLNGLLLTDHIWTVQLRQLRSLHPDASAEWMPEPAELPVRKMHFFTVSALSSPLTTIRIFFAIIMVLMPWYMPVSGHRRWMQRISCSPRWCAQSDLRSESQSQKPRPAH